MNKTLRRSVLYMPASNERALEKAKSIDADALIFDLEDAVSVDAKSQARELACAAVASADYGFRELTIRCNSLATPWGEDDIAAAAQANPSAIVIAKVGSAAEIDAVEALLGTSSTAIWAMIETPAGLLRAEEIAAHPRVEAFVLGTNDLAAELGATIAQDRTALLPHLSMSLLAARAAGICALDGVFNDVSDSAGFAAQCRQGAELGFDGKTLIHPSQVEPCNEAFSPSLAELDYHHRVVEAFDEAASQGQGVVTLDGKMIENLHVDEARRAIGLAEVIAQRSV